MLVALIRALLRPAPPAVDRPRHPKQTGGPRPLLTTAAERSETSSRNRARLCRRRDRGSFGEVGSSFRNVFVAAEFAAPERTTQGAGPAVPPLRNGGVLERGRNGEQEGITRFRAFFDSGGG